MATIIIPFITAFILAILLTPAVKSIALKLNAIDTPNGRKVHTKITPRLGGLAIYIAFIITIIFNFDIVDNHLKGVILGTFPIICCGVLDDFKEITYKTKLVFQLLSTVILISNDVLINSISIIKSGEVYSLELGILSIPLTVLWIIGVTNAINLIDGLDGLACGLSMISSAFLVIISLATGNLPMALMLAILTGACLGFLPYNINKAQIFLGDTGSLFLGFTLAALSIQGGVKSATAIIMIAPICIIGLPIYDTLSIMIRRFIQGKPIMSPDKQHFHHRMLEIGLSQKQILFVSYLVNIILGSLSIVFIFVQDISLAFILITSLVIISCILLDNVLYLIKTRKNK